MIQILKYACVIFSVIYLNACDDQSTTGNSHQSVPDLSLINVEYWDIPSKKVIHKYMGTSQDQLSYSQKKHITEVLITHDALNPAIDILKQMDYSQSQYLAYLLATAYYKQGKLQQALTPLENSSWHDMDSAVLNFKYKILLEMGLSKQLIELMDSDSQKIMLENTISNYYLAMAYLQNKQCKKAIPLFKQVIKKKPAANKIYVPLASAYQQCRKQNEAKQARQKQGNIALSNTDKFQERLMKNGNPVSYYNQSLTLALKHNNTDNIISAAEYLIQAGEKNIDLFHNYAIALYRANQLKASNNALFDAVKLDNDNVKSYQLLFEFNRRSNVEISRKAINQLIEIDPNNALYQQAKEYLNKK